MDALSRRQLIHELLQQARSQQLTDDLIIRPNVGSLAQRPEPDTLLSDQQQLQTRYDRATQVPEDQPVWFHEGRREGKCHFSH